MKTNIKFICAVVALVCVSFTGSGCGSANDKLKEVMGALAVASPTASRSGTSAALKMKQQSLFAKIQNGAVTFMNLFMPYTLSVADSAPDSDVKPFDSMVSELKTDLDSGAPEDIAKKIGNMSVTSYRANCYGPTWRDTARTDNSSTDRPQGDLGIVASAASSTDSTACAAAQMNSLIGGAPQFGNKLIKLQAVIVAALKEEGVDLPDAGGEVDALDKLPTIPGLTISEAKLSRLADRDGYKIYKTKVVFTDGSGKTGSATIYHSPRNDENTNYAGLIQAIVPHSSAQGSGAMRGVSMVYEQVDGVLSYALDTAANRQTTSDDFFNATSGRVDFTKTAFGEDGNRIIASFNSNNNAATMHYAWQAGAQDGAVRAFAIHIQEGTQGAQSGFAYFGFGAAIQNTTDNVSSPWMERMYCDWLAVLNTVTTGDLTTGAVTNVQGQKFSQQNGKFISTEDHIKFAPNTTCQKGAPYTVSNSIPSEYNGTYTITAHDLTTVGGVGTIPSVTVPTFNKPE